VGKAQKEVSTEKFRTEQFEGRPQLRAPCLLEIQRSYGKLIHLRGVKAYRVV
jgi:hypothetical protein